MSNWFGKDIFVAFGVTSKGTPGGEDNSRRAVGVRWERVGE